ncbi:MAG: pyridoxamine 5'-phosphate oxidase [Gammaproteobacteria bacterium]|nr:MAG: pyridoxamine 5'-phosphate oxidase [Gammaproteobacteria bacterium]
MKFKTFFRALFTLGKGVTTGLDELDVADDPIGFFRQWFKQAEDSGILLPESMCLATATPDGKPSARMVLLKEVDETGFVFYTNYASRKARELDANPHASLVFHWASLQRQVRVEGSVERVSAAEADAYFASRARGSQIGAWASKQSAVLDARETLEQRVHEMERRFGGEPVPRPEFWGGYRVIPEMIEFWQGRTSRLHDRLVYQREGEGWVVQRIYP